MRHLIRCLIHHSQKAIGSKLHLMESRATGTWTRKPFGGRFLVVGRSATLQQATGPTKSAVFTIFTIARQLKEKNTGFVRHTSMAKQSIK